MPPPTPFSIKKGKILATLHVPEEDYTDLSPKGSIDAPIRGLVDFINSIDGLVTTSSCSGRFVVYLDGTRGRKSKMDQTVSSRDVQGRDEGPEDEESGEGGLVTASSKGIELSDDVDGIDATPDSDTNSTGASGGKGGGTWLFTSHDPIDHEFNWRVILGSDLKQQVRLDDTTTVPSKASHGTYQKVSRLDPDARLVHCKFEPMILHILTSNLDTAKLVLGAAQASGFRESGIQGLTQSASGEITMVMIAVRSTGLIFDSLIASCSDNDQDLNHGNDYDYETQIRPAVGDEYLASMAVLANRNFKANAERTRRFQDALTKAFVLPKAWESAAARAARKRAEGLRKQASARNRPDTAPLTVEVDLQGLEMSAV